MKTYFANKLNKLQRVLLVFHILQDEEHLCSLVNYVIVCNMPYRSGDRFSDVVIHNLPSVPVGENAVFHIIAGPY
jgi:hypothetical protein